MLFRIRAVLNHATGIICNLANPKQNHQPAVTFLLVACAALLAGSASGANVNSGSGYTNDFSTQPAAADWSTRSVGTSSSAITTIAALDSAAVTNVASAITTQCASSNSSPPDASGLAVWSTSGYLQTRPTLVAATLLMGTFVNTTGTNATGIHINYDFTIRTNAAEEDVYGYEVFYSLTGAANSWVKIPGLSQTGQGKPSVDLTLSGTWTNGSRLYLLWADDNAVTYVDDANDIDNFYIAVTAGTAASSALAITLDAPSDGLSYPAAQALQASATVAGGTAPYTVTFYTNVLSGSRSSIAASGTFPTYTATISALPQGTYQVYAKVTDASTTVYSATNTFTMVTVQGAMVNAGTGYANSFGSQPAAIAWSTVAIGSGATTYSNISQLDAAVATVAASSITSQCVRSNLSPPGAYGLAVWSASGFLQTRPTGVGATLLMGSFVNNTGTNATSIQISYDYFIGAGTYAEAEDIYGYEVFYSLSGAAGSWIRIPALSQPYESWYNADLNLAGTWTNGSKLYVLWADDNANTYTDDGNEIDNFYIAVTGAGGTPPPLTITLDGPYNGESFSDTDTVYAYATISGGIPAYSVSFYTNAVGGPRAAMAASGVFPNYTANLGTLPEGTYQIYAQVTDGAGTIRSSTNAFTVAGPTKVPGSGVTVTFDTVPPVQKWSTYSVGTSVSDYQNAAQLDAAVMTLDAGYFYNACATSNASPPNASQLGVWSTSGYLQTRPTSVSATFLLGTFLNNTGSNATSLAISYDFAIRSYATSEEVRGYRVFYSFTGTANSWVLIPDLSQEITGTLSANVTLSGAWTNNSRLYLLWADDNGSYSPDDASSIDNVHIAVTGGGTNFPLFVTLNAPANGQTYSDLLSLTANATVTGGEGTYTVTFYTNAVGGPRGAITGSGSSSTYTANLGTFHENSYQVYAEASDGSTTARSATNTFSTVGAIKVPVDGVTFNFDTFPPVQKWSTVSVGSSSASQTLATMDASMTTNGAANINLPLATQVASGLTNLAYWRSSDKKLGTQPTGNRETLLMATLVNGTGAQVSDLEVSFTMGLASVEVGETNTGHRIYYSTTGLNNSWTPITFVDLSTVGSMPVSLTLSNLTWDPNTTLYLVWLDDNGTGSPLDGDYTIDDVTFTPTLAGLHVAVSGPANGQVILSSTAVSATAAVNSGTPPYWVNFYTNSGPGNTDFEFAGSTITSPPYTLNLGFLAAGTYNIYADAVDADGFGVTAHSRTNSFIVVNPLTATLTGPVNGGSYDRLSTINATCLVAGGTSPFTVRFYTNSVLAGTATGSNAFAFYRNLGAFVLGSTNTVSATVTDARNWTSNSPASTFSIVGPLGAVLLAPIAGATFAAPASVPCSVSAYSGGAGLTITGIGYYDVTRGFLGRSLTAPFSFTASLASAGAYQIYAVVTNNLGSFAYSGTNSITLTNVPLSVALTSPGNGQTFTSPATILCEATPAPGSAGIPIRSVAFYMTNNGATTFLFSDTTAPYSNQVAGLADGAYGIFAVVTNLLNATACSTTNVILVSSMVSGTITRGPYLGSRGETNIVVHWRTAETHVGRVRFGTSPGTLNSFADDTSSKTDHVVSIKGLLPDTRYYYSLGNTAGTIQTSTNYYFYTAPIIGTTRSTRVWVTSDFGTGNSTALATRNAYQNYITTNGPGPDLWLTGGDNEQNGTTGDDAVYQNTVFNIYTNFFQNVPFFPTPGNHDGGTESAYWNIFDLPQAGECGGAPSGSKHFYSYDYANIHFISIDCVNSGNLAPYADQVRWLSNDLATCTQQWKIAYWHFPSYCTNGYNSDTDSQLRNMRETFNPVLEYFGVDLVINGHCHVVQRTYLINQHYGLSTTFSPTNVIAGGDGHVDGNGAYLKTGSRGTVYITAPAGGGTDHTFNGTMPCFAEVLPNSVKGSISLEINANRLDLKVISTSGSIPAYFTILKGDSQSNAPVVPASFAAAANGTSAILTWANTTNEANYRLERSLNGAAFLEIATIGQNLSTYTNTGLNFANAYYYRLRAWNNAGYSDYTPVASLTPSATLAIDRQPQGSTNNPGDTVFFYVLARGAAPLSYQWYKGATLLTSETANTLKRANISSADAGSYTVQVSDGVNTLTSSTATLAVNITAQVPVLLAGPTIGGGLFSVSYQGTVGATYTIQSKDTLDAAWQDRTNVVVPLSGLILIQENNTAPQRFYRLISR
jgi:acid phosphatase type 7